MKKIVVYLTACLLSLPLTGQAFFGGGTISGPIAVYNTNASVDAATLATQINTAQQLAAALKNLETMDPGAAAANAGYIYSNLQQLISVQNNLQGMVMDYANFQSSWDSQYHDFADYAGMSGEQYSQNAQNLLNALNQSIYNAMQAQGFIANNSDTTAMLQQLLQASQTAQGAKAAAQVGNMIAAQQVQQMMQFQQMFAQSQRQQSEWLAYQAHKEAMAREANEQFFKQPSEPVREGGPGFVKIAQ